MTTTVTRQTINWARPVRRHAGSHSTVKAGVSGFKSTKSIIERTSAFLDAAVVINPIVFLATTAVLESTQPGYDRIRDTISSLVWCQYGWAQTAAFFLVGLTLIALVARLNSIANKGQSLRVGQVLLALIGIGFFVIAVFPTTSPFTGSTATSEIHRQAARAMFLVFPAMCFFVAKAMKRNERWTVLRRCTIAVGLLIMTMLPAGAIATLTNAPWLGGIERLITAWGLLWIEAVGIGLVLTTGQSQGNRTPTERETYGAMPNDNCLCPVTQDIHGAMWHNRNPR